MIFLSIEDILDKKNVLNILKELYIKDEVIDIDKNHKDLKIEKAKVIIIDYNEEKIKEYQKYKKILIVKLKSNLIKKNKNISTLLYKKNIYTYNSKNELREILTYIYKQEKRNKLIFAFLTVIILCIFSFLTYNQNKKLLMSKKVLQEKKINKEELLNKNKNENIIFLGDSLTELYELDKYFKDIPLVNSGTCGFTTEDIIKNLKDYVYIYNPTKVILLIGTNDFTLTNDSNEEIVERIKHIINEISKYRPKTEIFIESLYPINNNEDESKVDMKMVRDRTNERIQEINSTLEEYCKSNNIKYIDMYNELTDEEGNLNIEYTVDGLHVNNEGYEIITKKLKKYIEE